MTKIEAWLKKLDPKLESQYYLGDELQEAIALIESLKKSLEIVSECKIWNEAMKEWQPSVVRKIALDALALDPEKL